MTVHCVLCFALLAVATGCHRPATTSRSDDIAIAIPPDLLTYRNDSAHPPMDAGNLLDTDTYQRYDAIQSYPLLHAILLSPGADDEVLSFDIERALLLVGPVRFFADVRADAKTHLSLFATGRRKALIERSKLPHVWIDQSAAIDNQNMAAPVVTELFGKMIADVEKGKKFEDVYSQLELAYRRDNGTGRVGNFGNFVLSTTKPDAKPFRDLSLPLPDIERLLATPSGKMIVLDFTEENALPIQHSKVLYHVRETYTPPKQ